MSTIRDRAQARLQASGRYPRWVLFTCLAGMFATTFPVTILTVSLGDIAREFGVSETVMAWVISAPLLTSALALPITGKLGDLYGHRRIFVGGFALATVAAVLTALAWDAYSLIGFRTLAQVIGAATQPTALALITGVYAPRDRVKAIGWWSLVAAGAPTIGLVVGGPTVEVFGWRLVFVAQAALGFVALLVAVVVLRETSRRAGVRFDVAGAVALSLGTGGVMILLTQGVEWGWTHPLVVASAVAAPAATLAFIRIERRVPEPLLPLGFFALRNFTAPTVASFLSGAAYMGGFILAPLLLRFEFGYSLSAVALIMVLRPLSYSLASPLGGQMATRIGERTTGVLGTAVLSAGLLLLAAGAAGHELGAVAVGLFLQGIGNGVSRPPLTSTLMNAVDRADLGIAAASQRMVFQIGGSFGIAAMTVVYAGRNAAGPFARAFAVGALIGLAGTVAATFVRSEDRRTDATEVAEARLVETS